ncbi:nuclear factor interleukin-3-regulated protein-like [Narcine bancroftii]|uniref:nuclear factor interleukin-3-regulated protein-like n=1 Tax=Narcine bancroftii TaxID=1343680 RepID=UPI0038316370
MLSAFDLVVDLEPPSLKHGSFRSKLSTRRKREFMPEEKKDASYWEKRRKNNEAAKRSREKRRFNDMVLESKMLALSEENACLRAELLTLKVRCGLITSSAYAQEAQLVHSYLQKCLARQKTIEMDSHLLEMGTSFWREMDTSLRDDFCNSHTRYSSRGFSIDSQSTPQHTQESPFHRLYTNPVSVGGQKEWPPANSAECSMQHIPLDHLRCSKYPYSFSEAYSCYKPSSVIEVSSKRESGDDAEEEIPKMYDFSHFKNCRFECSPPVKSNCSALPHKLRIKAKPILAKERKDLPEFDLEMSWKGESPLENTRISMNEIKDSDVSVCDGIYDCKAAL